MSDQLTLTACPDPKCGAPAEVVDEVDLASTDGRVTAVRTFCARRHIFDQIKR